LATSSDEHSSDESLGGWTPQLATIHAAIGAEVEMRRRAGCVVLTAGLLMAAWPRPSATAAEDPSLVESARREGQVVWYTTQIINQLAVPMADAFKAAYGIDVKFIRANPREVARRVTEETKTGRPQADVVDGTLAVPMLKKAGLVLAWQPADAARLPPDMIDPDGVWVATNVFINSVGYNTELVPRGSEPRSYDDLLKPQFRGRIGWSANPAVAAAPGFIGTVLQAKGEAAGRAYLKALADQQIISVDVSARQVLDAVIAGEFLVGLQIFNHHAAISAAKGAPVAWVPLEPVTGSLSVAAVLRAAPHPNAAKLFVTFLVSEQGQRLFRDADYLPVDPKVPPKDGSLLPDGGKFRTQFFTPEAIESKMRGWVALFDELFR
jgi:ABC-type Fe3+ transport system substrate-binding protein